MKENKEAEGDKSKTSNKVKGKKKKKSKIKSKSDLKALLLNNKFDMIFGRKKDGMVEFRNDEAFIYNGKEQGTWKVITSK